MRILILHSRYRSGPVSGENRVVDDEARLLRSHGQEVDVYSPVIANTGPLGLARSGASTVWSVRAAREVATRVRRHRPDVVHVHNLFPALSPAVLRAVPLGTACVMTLHNYRLVCLPSSLLREGRICEDCVRRTPWPGVMHGCYQGSVAASGVLASSLVLHRTIASFERVDLFAAISEFVRDKHVDSGVAPERITVKTNFAWAAQRREGSGDYFLFLGRLVPEKGVRTLLEAWRGLDARLLVAGDGPDAAALRADAPDGVQFLGPVEADDVPALIARARAVLVPSIWFEAAGKVVLEAYAAGVPVVASRIGALPEFVDDGVTGLLVTPGEPSAWRDAVLRLSDDAVNDRMGAAGRDVWEREYSPEVAATRLEALYRHARARASGRTG